MPKNILGIALCEVRGLLNDLMEKLCGEDGKMWLDAFKKFLRKENSWGFGGPICDGIFKVVVNYSLSIKELSKGYDKVGEIGYNPYNAETQDPNEKGMRELEFILIHSKAVRYYALQAIGLMGFGITKWRPATIKELLAFGNKYPELQRKFQIYGVITGKKYQDGCMSLGVLLGNSSFREVKHDCICGNNNPATSHDCFLAVRE